MQTYSHFLVTALAQDRLKQKGVPVHTKGILLGSFMPDVPLIIFTLGFFIYYRWLYPPPNDNSLFGPLYDNYYFHDPVWITGHSLFHSPIPITLWMALGYYFGLRRGKKWGVALFWFAIGCAFHTFIDILTHFNDGPLLFYPFNWQYRFSSPISYWDPRRYGGIFAIFEHLLNVGAIGYFIGRSRWVREKLSFLKIKQPQTPD